MDDGYMGLKFGAVEWGLGLPAVHWRAVYLGFVLKGRVEWVYKSSKPKKTGQGKFTGVFHGAEVWRTFFPLETPDGDSVNWVISNHATENNFHQIAGIAVGVRLVTITSIKVPLPDGVREVDVWALAASGDLPQWQSDNDNWISPLEEKFTQEHGDAQWKPK